eukprot:364708-Chlamydomonas_euryale.AAC.16
MRQARAANAPYRPGHAARAAKRRLGRHKDVGNVLRRRWRGRMQNGVVSRIGVEARALYIGGGMLPPQLVTCLLGSVAGFRCARLHVPCPQPAAAGAAGSRSAPCRPP